MHRTRTRFDGRETFERNVGSSDRGGRGWERTGRTETTIVPPIFVALIASSHFVRDEHVRVR